MGEMNVCGSTRSRGRLPIVLLLTASGSGLDILCLSAAKEDALAKALVETLVLALFEGGLDGTLFLESLRAHAAGACGVSAPHRAGVLRDHRVYSWARLISALCLFELPSCTRRAQYERRRHLHLTGHGHPRRRERGRGIQWRGVRRLLHGGTARLALRG